MIKAVLLDFDGTLVTKDILDVVCGIVGKEEESKKLNDEFHAGVRDGISSLIERVNFLGGVSLGQITEKLNQNAFLAKGAGDLLHYLRENNIATILASGNIIPVLQFYQKLLGIDYIIGTYIKMHSSTIVGIDRENLPQKGFKVHGIEKILHGLSIDSKDTLAIGDSPADKALFAFAGKSIATNSKGGIERFADYVINDDLNSAIEIVERLNS